MTVVGDAPAGLQRESADSGTVQRDREARDTPCRPPWNRHVLADATSAVLQERLWCGRSDAVDTPDEPQRWEQTPDVSADMQEARLAENWHRGLVEPRMHKRHNQRTEAVVSNKLTQMSQLISEKLVLSLYIDWAATCDRIKIRSRLFANIVLCLCFTWLYFLGLYCYHWVLEYGKPKTDHHFKRAWIDLRIILVLIRGWMNAECRILICNVH